MVIFWTSPDISTHLHLLFFVFFFYSHQNVSNLNPYSNIQGERRKKHPTISILTHHPSTTPTHPGSRIHVHNRSASQNSFKTSTTRRARRFRCQRRKSGAKGGYNKLQQVSNRWDIRPTWGLFISLKGLGGLDVGTLHLKKHKKKVKDGIALKTGQMISTNYI